MAGTGTFKGSPLRFRLEKWLWVALTVAVIITDVWFPAFWQRISIVYLAVVSNYALVAALASCEQAAEAKQEAAKTTETAERLTDDLSPIGGKTT